MTIAGMSIGSWILIIVICVWAVLAIKSYFFGGIKSKKKGAQIGNCCDTGDEVSAGCKSCSARGDAETAASANAVLPVVRDIK